MSAATPEDIKPKSTLLEGVILQDTQKEKDDALQDQLNELEGQKLKNKDEEDNGNTNGIIPVSTLGDSTCYYEGCSRNAKYQC